jgi:hypothetical protein
MYLGMTFQRNLPAATQNAIIADVRVASKDRFPSEAVFADTPVNHHLKLARHRHPRRLRPIYDVFLIRRRPLWSSSRPASPHTDVFADPPLALPCNRCVLPVGRITHLRQAHAAWHLPRDIKKSISTPHHLEIHWRLAIHGQPFCI